MSILCALWEDVKKSARSDAPAPVCKITRVKTYLDEMRISRGLQYTAESHSYCVKFNVSLPAMYAKSSDIFHLI